MKSGPPLSHTCRLPLHLQPLSSPGKPLLVLNMKLTEDPFPQDYSPWNTIHLPLLRKAVCVPGLPVGSAPSESGPAS